MYVYVYGEDGRTQRHGEAVRGLVLASKDVVHLFLVWIGCEQIRQRMCVSSLNIFLRDLLGEKNSSREAC